MLGSVHEPENFPIFFDVSIELTEDFTSPMDLFLDFGKFYYHVTWFSKNWLLQPLLLPIAIAGFTAHPKQVNSDSETCC